MYRIKAKALLFSSNQDIDSCISTSLQKQRRAYALPLKYASVSASTISDLAIQV